MSTDPKPMGPSLQRLLSHLGAPKASTVVDVFDRWPELVGAEIAKHSRPVSFSDNTLTVKTDDAAWASQLRWAEKELLAKLSLELGSDDVRALEIRVD